MLIPTFLKYIMDHPIRQPHCLVILLILISSFSYAQTFDIHSLKIDKKEQLMLDYCDSLSNVDYQKSLDYSLSILKEISFSKKPRIYNALVFTASFSAYHTGDLKLSDSLTTLLLTLPMSNIHPHIKADLFYHQARSLRMQKRYLDALNLVKEALLIYRSSNDIESQIRLQVLLMTIYQNMENKELAQETYLENLSFLDKKINKDLKLILLKGISGYLVITKQYKQASKALDKAWDIALQADDDLLKARLILLRGLFFYQQKNYAKSDMYFKQAIKESEILNNRLLVAKIYTIQASAAMRMKEYTASLNYNRLALNIREKAHSMYLTASSHVNIANNMIHLQQYDSARIYLNIGEEILLKYGTKIDLDRLLLLRQNLLLLQGDYKKAFLDLKRGIGLKDSLFRSDNRKKLSELESTYEWGKFEQQKREIEAETDKQYQQNKRNRLLFRLVLIVLFLSFLAGFLLYQYAVTRNKRRLLSINQQMIMIQMNSHFVFNALTAIQSLIYKNKIEAAIYNLTLFSNLLNRIIAISLQQKISLQAELSFIEEFLLIQKLRFGNHLQFKIDIAEEVDVDRLRLPPLLLYPFLEYAAEECIQQVSEKTLILIRISQDHGFLIYEMIDLGLGFSNLELCYIKRYGGQKILCEDFTLERISLHNRFLKTKLIFAKNKYEYLGKEYSALQFKIKL